MYTNSAKDLWVQFWTEQSSAQYDIYIPIMPSQFLAWFLCTFLYGMFPHYTRLRRD